MEENELIKINNVEQIEGNVFFYRVVNENIVISINNNYKYIIDYSVENEKKLYELMSKNIDEMHNNLNMLKKEKNIFIKRLIIVFAYFLVFGGLGILLLNKILWLSIICLLFSSPALFLSPKLINEVKSLSEKYKIEKHELDCFDKMLSLAQKLLEINQNPIITKSSVLGEKDIKKFLNDFIGLGLLEIQDELDSEKIENTELEDSFPYLEGGVLGEKETQHLIEFMKSDLEEVVEEEQPMVRKLTK